ncbi:MAG TPA: SGNH/GDSL hydrolase family protein [Candidatus Acidoferrum sp.]|nr:SGNH/GDSL hydrolase family protein [Candidatus Acidoferrum sp.]
MKRILSCILSVLLLGSLVVPVQAAFNALYVFGDCISATTNNTSGLPFYYGQRYSNGRVWVEVLAQRQGLTFDNNKNWSYFYNSSTTLVANVTSFQPPADVGNDLFVIWVNCADLWFPAYNSGVNMASWTSAINTSQTNHFKAVTNLYAKGVRTLVMPNAVDVSTIPAFNTSVNASFIHQRCVDYNFAFSNTLNRIRAACPNLRLYTPDFFALLTNLLTYPASYGLINIYGNGKVIDAVDAVNYGYPAAVNNGFGTNAIFWDPQDPTAMVHMWMANLTQQLISPVQISGIALFNGSNRLDLANVPVGQDGLVLGSTNLGPWIWTTNAGFASTNPVQSVFVLTSLPAQPSLPLFTPNDGPPMPPGNGEIGGTNIPPTMQLYRLQFPYAWTWP